MSGSMHEDLSRAAKVTGGSDRSFGLVFGGFFALIALVPLIRGGAVHWWAIALAAAFLAVAMVRPALLAPANRAWMRFALLLSKIVNPIMMGLVFFLAVTPVALIMRMRGKDPLRLRFDRGAQSYWIERTPPGPAPDSMPRQF